MPNNYSSTMLRLLAGLLAIVTIVADAQSNHHTEVDTTFTSTVATVVGVDSEQCTAADCNERGTCFGTKAMPFCLCQIGFAGLRCQETYCDSARDCSGHGWCMGTASQNTCLCSIGFAGTHCEKEVPVMMPTLPQFPTVRTTPATVKESTSDATGQHQQEKEVDVEGKNNKKPDDVLEEHSTGDDAEPVENNDTRQHEHEEEHQRDVRQHSRDLRTNIK